MIRSTLAATALGVTTVVGVSFTATATVAQAATSTGTHVNEGVVATAANPSVPNHFATSFPTVQAGSDGNNVKALTYLLLGNGVSAPVTTSYTTAVSNAVKSYQSGHGLPVTGIADPTTLAALSTQLTSGTTSARTQAAAVLLNKHGYPTTLSSSLVKNLDASMLTSVHDFQAGHGITQSSYIGDHTWATLFSAKTSGPIFPQMQANTGAASWNNCGPVSSVVVTLNKGITPKYWNNNPASNSATVTYFRYTLIGIPNTYNDNKYVGTVPKDIIPAFAKEGIPSYSGSINDVMNAARSGRPSVAGGDGYQLSWNRLRPSNFSGPDSHFIAVVGWDGTNYLVVDPAAEPNQNYVHLLTPSQLANFGSTAPGWGPNVAGNNVPPSQNNIITR